MALLYTELYKQCDNNLQYRQQIVILDIHLTIKGFVQGGPKCLILYALGLWKLYFKTSIVHEVLKCEISYCVRSIKIQQN